MITLENKTLADYLMFKLDKIENKFSKEELGNIKELTLDPVTIENTYEPIDLNILKYFSNLRELELINLFITIEDLNNIKNLSTLESITFEKCEFENITLIKELNIKSLELINTKIPNPDFIYEMIDLNSLSIVNDKIKIKGINNLNNLTYLQLSSSILSDPNEAFALPNLKELYIDNTNIDDLTIINDLKQLKILSISENQYRNNKNIINSMVKNNIVVLEDGLVRIGGEIDV